MFFETFGIFSALFHLSFYLNILNMLEETRRFGRTWHRSSFQFSELCSEFPPYHPEPALSLFWNAIMTGCFTTLYLLIQTNRQRSALSTVVHCFFFPPHLSYDGRISSHNNNSMSERTLFWMSGSVQQNSNSQTSSCPSSSRTLCFEISNLTLLAC